MTNDGTCSRRTMLATLAGSASVAFSGCSHLLQGAKISQRYQSYRPEPVLYKYKEQQPQPPFFTQTITSQDEAQHHLNFKTIPKSNVQSWENIDYSRYTVTVLISNLLLNGGKKESSVEIDGSFDSNTYTYNLTISEWPKKAILNSQQAYYTIMDKWENTPEDGGNAIIKVDFI